MMKAEDLKNSVLQMAMQGKLVPQDPNDEPASVLLEKIKQEKEQLIKNKKIKRNNKESTIWKENGHWYEKIGKNGDTNCIDEEIPFNISEKWCWAKLNIIGFIQTGNTPPTKNPENYGDYIPFIKPGDIYYHKINYENEFLSKIGESKGRLIKKNSVMMVCIGGSRGKCYYNNQDVCCNQQINTITPYLIDYRFIFYYFCTKYFQNKMINDATGTATPLVNKTSWSNFFIPIPPLNEQKRIVEKLEQILPQIEQYGKYEEQLTKLNEELPDKLKKSILQQAIQGKLVPQNPEDEPASKLLEKIKQEKEQLIKDKQIKQNKNESTIYKKDGHWYEVIDKFNEVKCIDEEIPFDIPESWCWSRLNTICTKITDGSHNPPSKKEKGFPVLSVKNIYQDKLSFDTIYRYCDKEGFEKENKRTNIKKGDLLLGIVGSIGSVAIYNSSEKVIAQRSLSIINSLISQTYLKYIFKTHYFNEFVKDNSRGTAQKGLYLNSLKQILIPVPPLNEQRRIVEVIEKLMINSEKLIY